MSQAKVGFQTKIVGVGHAMCDVSAELENQAWDLFRTNFFGLPQGVPVHLDAARAHSILSYLEESAAKGQCSLSYAAGGAALNAVRVASSLGVKASFLGSVGNDRGGDIIRTGLSDAGVVPVLYTSEEGEGTGMFCTVYLKGMNADSRSSVERFIVAAPAAARHIRDLGFDSFDLDDVGIIHAEGLLADEPRNLEAFFQRARDMKKMISLDMVSMEATRRCKNTLRALIRRYADFVFCNQAEFEALDLSICDYSPAIVWLIKRDRAGVDCYTRGQIIHVDAPRCTVVDELGAGDAFAGAFLGAYLAGKPLRLCLELGTKAAACALQSRGPVPDKDCLRALSREILAE